MSLRRRHQNLIQAFNLKDENLRLTALSLGEELKTDYELSICDLCCIPFS